MTTKTQLQLKDRVLDLMKNDDSFLDACLLTLFEQQTIDERQIKNSVYQNSAGFNRPDAYLLSDYSIWKLNFPDKSISKELKTKLINKLEKYALQLLSYDEIVAVVDDLKESRSIISRVKNEIDVDELDPNTSLKDYLNYRKLKRKVELRERFKRKREEEERSKLRLTHEIIKGTIVEIEPKAVKIKTTYETIEMELWFPKFSIMKGYKEELNIVQDFTIKKRMVSSKLKEALSEKKYDD